jgi:hypothetical protein
MKDSLYYLKASTFNLTQSLEWKIFTTKNTPISGLLNYGLAVTQKGRIVLHGGFTANGQISRTRRNWNVHSDLWLLELNGLVSDFYVVKLRQNYGGYSRLFSLGQERICMVNNNIKWNTLIIDFENMSIESFNTETKESDIMNRTAFGIVPISNSMAIILGGYITENGTIKEQTPFLFGLEIKYISPNKTETPTIIVVEAFSADSNTLYLLFALVIIPVVIGVIVYYYKHRMVGLIPETELWKK